MLRHGADIRVIQRILGHSSIATTQIYTYVDTSLLKETFERAKPKY
jgi:site-specific recombinase XerD